MNTLLTAVILTFNPRDIQFSANIFFHKTDVFKSKEASFPGTPFTLTDETEENRSPQKSTRVGVRENKD